MPLILFHTMLMTLLHVSCIHTTPYACFALTCNTGVEPHAGVYPTVGTLTLVRSIRHVITMNILYTLTMRCILA
jgi:hypothetical protein